MTFTTFLTQLRQLDWLGLFLASWVAPLVLDDWFGLTYLASLIFWGPALLLWPRFAALTDSGGRRRRALLIAVLEIVVLGLLLDFVFGKWILTFEGQYLFVFTVPWLGASVPIEEVCFYILSPIAILLVYAWCDEYWMVAYNPVEERLAAARRGVPLLSVSRAALVLGIVAEAAGIAAKQVYGGPGFFPTYYTFLALGAFAPAVMLFERVSALVNWRAFGITLCYVLITSLLWEPALALPRLWWGYQDSAMMGIAVRALTVDPTHPFPLEAALVWLCGPFTCVLTYETVKAWQYKQRPLKAVYGDRLPAR